VQHKEEKKERKCLTVQDNERECKKEQEEERKCVKVEVNERECKKEEKKGEEVCESARQ
jgi:hypothetical protein